jgi:hypothetical protein
MDSRWIHVLFNSGDELTQFLFYLSCFSLLVAIVSGARRSAVVLLCFLSVSGSFWVVHFENLVTIVSLVGFGFGVYAWRGQAGRRSEQSLFP